tara:strand:+ start:2177 stop:3109 length:933 start_codon:yes stop_codon:yes gene_type:complete
MDENTVLFLKLKDNIIKHRFIGYSKDINDVHKLRSYLLEKKTFEENDNIVFTYNGNIVNNGFTVEDGKSILCFNVFENENNTKMNISTNSLLESILTNNQVPNMDNLMTVFQNYGLTSSFASHSNAFSQISENPMINIDNMQNMFTLVDDSDSENINNHSSDEEQEVIGNSDDNSSSDSSDEDEENGESEDEDGIDSDENEDEENGESDEEDEIDSDENEDEESGEDNIENPIGITNEEINNITNQIQSQLMNIYNSTSNGIDYNAIKEKYQEGFETMVAMGFHNDDRILQSLQICEGNIENAVNYYLSY